MTTAPAAFSRGLRTCGFAALLHCALATAQAAAAADVPSSETLVRVFSSPWIEERHYEDLPPGEVRVRMREDYAFDRWLAARARREGVEVLESERRTLNKYRLSLISQKLQQALATRERPSSDTIARAAEEQGWLTSHPERYLVSYLFIDATGARTQEESRTIRERAGKIRAELTPENFADMARLWSDVPSSEEGGDLGAVDLTGLGPSFSDHVRRTAPGTIGGPYETRSGWNIVYVRSKVPPHNPKFTREQLESMTAGVLTSRRLRQAAGSPADLDALWQQLGKPGHATMEEEMGWYESFLVSKRWVQSRIDALSPSEDDLRAEFEKNRERLTAGERRKASEILLTGDDWTTEGTREAWLTRRQARDRARDLRRQILDGADFAALARRHSIAPSASRGGDLGWVQMPSSYLVDSTLAALQPGDVSPPRLTERGYWFARLEAVEPRRPLVFDEARSQVERIWSADRRRVLLDSLRDEWRREAGPARSGTRTPRP